MGAIARGLGLSVACTSKHLSILGDAGLVELRRAGRETRCRLAPEGSEGAGLLRLLGLAPGIPPPPGKVVRARRPARPLDPEARTDGEAPSEVPFPRRPMAAPELEPSRGPSIRRYRSNDFEDPLR